ncbi:SET domain-containing protein SmydA-8-like [Lycorma delicatula]|uniref:SET domain-containing protein SmydA-8-like n=1 Tax=Lycorma delicatula TaxID=130591 RepID=UPI003F51990D
MPNIKEIDTENEKKNCAVCNEKAPHMCSVCRAVSYCSKEHQKQHWKQHKLICNSYEVKLNNQLGRYLIASRDLSTNDKIISESPLILGPKMFEPTPLCLGCYRPPTPGVRCPNCLWPFCHPQCPGLTDPHHHSVECFILSLGKSLALQPGILRYEIITPLRCLLLQKRNKKKWQQIMTMEAHSNSRGPETEIYKELEDLVVNYLIENYLKQLEEGLNYSKELLQRICGVLDVNALEIRGAGDIGLLALYPTICLLEHNCLPNTIYHYSPEFKITLSPIANIKKGEHLSTSYTHVLWGTQDRREHLKQNKYFDCKCERCSDPTELGSYISALKCHGLLQDNTCSGWQLPIAPLEDSEWKCDKCPVTLKSDEAKNLVSMLSMETDTTIKQIKPPVGQVTDLLKKLKYFLHPHHYLCYETKHLLIQLYGHQPGFLHHELTVEQLQNKEGICRELLSINKILDRGYGRLCLYSAVLMYELQSAIVELTNRKTSNAIEEAKSLLTQTANILKYEPMNSPGSVMRTLAKKTLHELEFKQGIQC